MHDFLVEVHTEELPPKSLQRLSQSFLAEVEKRLQAAELNFEKSQAFATPRRLGLLITALAAKQKDTVIERKGPALKAAYDDKGQATAACLGFARALKVDPCALIILKSAQGEWVGFRQKRKGESSLKLLGPIVEAALASLPIAKRMRWGDGNIEFVRPVHSVIMLYGSKIIPYKLFDLRPSNKTQGHRLLSRSTLTIREPKLYEKILEKNYVIADFFKRKALIQKALAHAVKSNPAAHILLDNALLDEVTGLVEWPHAILGQFDKRFLRVPQEVLISAMQDHQRYFPVVNKKNKLLPFFVAICNMRGKYTKNIIQGNERVLCARLEDAAFFFETDKKQKLHERIPLLKNRLFQKKLGSMYDKSERMAKLSEPIANLLGCDVNLAHEASLLAKTDLTTQLVSEFPELQGTAGFYYAKHEGLPIELATALSEQYLPRYAGDKLPQSILGGILGLVDRLDTLVGVFGINQAPTGDKDPFALRRAALGVLRILIENKFNLDLKQLIALSVESFHPPLPNKTVASEVFQFIMERLKYWYQEQDMPSDIFASVAALNLSNPFDFHQRMVAVRDFKKKSEALALSSANKRVSQILLKYPEKLSNTFNADLFEDRWEKKLADILVEKREKINLLHPTSRYIEMLNELASLKDPIDNFFDKVLVMTEDKNVRENRLLLLQEIRALFLKVADIALLQA